MKIICKCGVCPRCFERRWAGKSPEERRLDLIDSQREIAKKAGFTIASEAAPPPPPDLGQAISKVRSTPSTSASDRVKQAWTPQPVGAPK